MRIRGQGGLLWKMLPLVRLGFSFLGRDWNQFYAWMLNRQEQRNTIGLILRRSRRSPGKDKGLYDVSRGEYHLEYLKRYGLLPGHCILDFGCGFGRTAIPLLGYLKPGRYVGVELSAERIRLAREWVARDGLEDTRPRWIVSMDSSMPYLEDGSVDYIWANSVFTHMPRGETEKAILGAWRVMQPGGVALFNYSISADDSVRNSGIKDFQYPPGLIEGLVRKTGFAVERLDDWQDDLVEEQRAKHNIMLKAVRPVSNQVLPAHS